MNGFNLSNIQDASLGATSLSSIYLGSTQLWTAHDYTQNPLTFKALSELSVSVNIMQACTLYYKSESDTTWQELSLSTGETLISTLNIGDTICFASNNWTNASINSYNKFVVNGNFNVYGNIMSLKSKDNFVNTTSLGNGGEFQNLFYDCTGMISASDFILPATTIGQYAYRYMFYGCTGLVRSPRILPATGNTTFNHMFDGCTSLTTVPTIQDTSIAYACCGQMFYGCTSLVNASNLMPNVTTLNSECFGQMFYGCTSLKNPPTLPETDIPQGGCNQMFRGCTSLTTAPDIIADNIGTWGCYQMFYECSNLNYVKCTATTKSGSSNFSSWLYGVAASGTFVKDANSTLWGSGASGIPSGWTVVNI